MSSASRSRRTDRGFARVRVIWSLVMLALVPLWLWADAPAWWTERGVINPAATADDYAAVNQGQVKHIAKQAYEAFNAKLPGGAGGTLAGIWASPTASTDDYQAINLGQLKNVAKPFYDRLQAAGYTGQPLTAGQVYPWDGATSADDYALANIGQVKNLFSFAVSSVGEEQNYYLTLVSGNHQVGASGSVLPQPLTVRVTDASGQLVSGQAVTFAIASGGGSLSTTALGAGTASLQRETGVAGEAVVYLKPTGAAGAITGVSATLSGGSVVFTAYVGGNVASSAGDAEVPEAPNSDSTEPGGEPEQTVNDIDLINPGSPNFKYPVLNILPRDVTNYFTDPFYYFHDWTQPELSWTYGSFLPTSSRIERRVDGGEWEAVADVTGRGYIHFGLVAGRLYEYRVCLMKQQSVLAYSNIQAYDVSRISLVTLNKPDEYRECGYNGVGFNKIGFTHTVFSLGFELTATLAIESNPAEEGTRVPRFVEQYMRGYSPIAGYMDVYGDGEIYMPYGGDWQHVAQATALINLPVDGSEVSGPEVPSEVWGYMFSPPSPNSGYLYGSLEDGPLGAGEYGREAVLRVSEYIPYYLTFHGARLSCYSLPEDGLKWDGNGPITIERPDYKLTGVSPLALTWSSAGSSAAILLYKQIYNSATYTWGEPIGPLPGGTQLQPGEKFIVKLNPTEPSIETVTLTLTDSDATDGVSTQIKYANRQESPGANIPLSESSGAKYRKIALNGAPLSDEKPQQESESDQSREETFIDALTLGLRHDTTDTYMAVPAADLFLGARRSITSEIWTARRGLRPDERPDRPFGTGWTTNLAASIQFTHMLGTAAGNTIENPDTATVTDENGASYTFAILYGAGATYSTATGYSGTMTFVPLPTSKHELSTQLTSLVKDGANYVFKRKYGSTLVYAMSGLEVSLPSDRIDGSSSGEKNTWARLMSVTDRYGNALDYAYSGTDTLVPATIQVRRAGGGGAAFSIRQNTAGLITDIWDTKGYQVSYAYTHAGNTWELTTATASDGKQTHYEYAITPEVRNVPAAVDEHDEPRYHFNLTEITDPLGHAYTFDYAFDETKYDYTTSPDSGGELAGQNYYIKAGVPMYVSKVTLPNGDFSEFDNSESSVRLVRNETSHLLEFSGTRRSRVTDAEGNERVYDFTNTLVEEMESFASIYHKQEKFDVPRMIYYRTMAITSYQKDGAEQELLGSESFTFDPSAGMSVTSATDFSGNTTTYVYGDGVISIGGSTTFYSDPTSQTNALNKTKHFTYGDHRIMTSSTDEEGVKTQWTVDSLGRRTEEQVFPAGSTTAIQHTVFSYGSTTFPNFMTKKTVKKLATATDDPTWVKDLVTLYVPDANGRVAQEVVDMNENGTVDTGTDLITETTYDANGNKLTTTDPRGNVTHFSYDKRNRLTHVTYADAHQKRFYYDDRGNKVKETDENGVATLWDYDALNRVVRQAVDMNGNEAIDPSTDLVTSYTYNKLNAKLTTTNPNGTVTKFEYDALQRLVKKTDDYSSPTTGHFNYVTTYEYEKAKNPGGSVFNSSGFKPTKVTDPRGYVTEVTYDDLYRPTEEKVQYALSPAAYAITKKAYDDVGNLTQVTAPAATVNGTLQTTGTITQTTYDDLRRPTTVTQALGLAGLAVVSKTEYTSTGFAWKTIADYGDGTHLNRTTTTEYDHAGRPVKVYAPAVDDALTTVTTPVTPITETRYDAAGNVSYVINPLGRRTDYAYDNRNRRYEEKLPPVTDATTGEDDLRPIRTTAYDGVGNVIAVQDARGFITTTDYDNARRPVTVTAPPMTLANGTTVYPETSSTYDAAGNVLTVTDANDHVTTNTYDALNRLATTLQKPDLTDSAHDILVTNEYDPAGNRTAVIDGKGQRTEFTYDGLSRNLTVKDPANRTVTFTYDALNKVSRTDSLSQSTTYLYDARHRLTDVSYVGRTQDNRSYAYDLLGQLLSVTEPGKPGNQADVAYTYDALGRQLTETSGGKQHVYAYDLANNRVTVTYGGTGTVLTSTYDAHNRLQTLSETPSLSSQLSTLSYPRITTYGYDLNGNRVLLALPNGEETDTQYDPLNRAVAITTSKASGALLLQLTQTYDPVGNLTGLTERHYGSGLAPRTVTNTYDAVNRLKVEVNAETGSVPKTTATTYGFDPANNRTSRAVATTTGSGTTLVETAYVYNNLNQLETATTGTAVTHFTYDWNGNRVERVDPNALSDTYTYDYENRLVSLTKDTTGGTGTYAYVYDYRTRRVLRSETQGSTTTLTQQIFSGGVSVSEYSAANLSALNSQLSASAAAVEYIRGSDWGGGVGGLLYSVRSGVPSFKHYNSRGDVISETDATGAATWQGTYEAFGTRTQEVGTTADRQKANTKEEDPTGLLNEGFRYRDLDTGTFITRDPMGFVDGPNMYAYVVQNPWSKFDPEGLFFREMLPSWAQSSFSSSALGPMDRTIDGAIEAKGVYSLTRSTGSSVLGAATTATGVAVTRATGAMDWAEAVHGEKIVVGSGGQVSTQAIEHPAEVAVKALGGAAGMTGTGFAISGVVAPKIEAAIAANVEAKVASAPPPLPSAQGILISNNNGKIWAGYDPATKNMHVTSIESGLTGEKLSTQLYADAISQAKGPVKSITGQANGTNRLAIEQAGGDINAAPRTKSLKKLGYDTHSYDPETRIMKAEKKSTEK